MNIVAFVVGYNEANNLKNCLAGLRWCNRIIYCDMGSQDNSIQIAEECNAEIKEIDFFPCVELVHLKYCNDIDCDLLLLTDPDEVINTEMFLQIEKALSEFDINYHSELRANMYYYFKKKKLNGTFWGGKYSARFIYNKRFIKFTGLVHDGVNLSVNNPYFFNWQDSSYIEHYWTKGWIHLYKKHRRYLLKEGESMFNRSLRFSKKNQIKETLNAFYFSYWSKKGIKEGFVGLMLSMFWMWYTYKRWTSLKKFQNFNQNTTK